MTHTKQLPTFSAAPAITTGSSEGSRCKITGLPYPPACLSRSGASSLFTRWTDAGSPENTLRSQDTKSAECLSVRWRHFALYPKWVRIFYPDERCDFQWLANRWFLSTTRTVDAGAFEVRADRELSGFRGGIHPATSKLIDIPQIEVSAGILREDWGSEDKPQLASHLVPALILSLYNTQFFDVNVILLSDPGWRLVRHKFVEPHYRSTGDPSRYEVTADRWSGFETFIKLAEVALKNLISWRSFVTASKRYMTATFAFGDPLRPWDVEARLTYMGLNFENSAVRDLTDSEDFSERPDIEESALLQYVFALEALLTGDEKQAIAEKIASGSALLIGQNDDERRQIHRAVKSAYNVRSTLVHGRKPEDRIAPMLWNLRRILQRVMVVTTSLAAEDYPKEVQYREVLRLLPISETLQSQVARCRERCFEIIPDCSQISGIPPG